MKRLAAVSAVVLLSAGLAAPAWGVQNSKPVLAAIGDRTVAEAQLLTFTAVAADPEGDPVQFSLFPPSKVPPGASIGAASGVFAWTADESQGPGSYTFKVVANDDKPGPGTQQKITVTVAEVNQPPVVAAVPDRSDEVGTAVGFTVSAADADIPANSITWSATGIPPGVSFSGGQFSGSPNVAGVYQVTVSAVDDGEPALGGLALFAWTVTDPNDGGDPGPPLNQPPTLGPIPDRADVAGTTVSFQVSAADPEGGALSFSASGLPPGMGMLSGGIVSGTLDGTAASASPYSVTVTVTDDGGASASASFTWTVSEPPPPPSHPDTGTGDGTGDAGGGGGGPPPTTGTEETGGGESGGDEPAPDAEQPPAGTRRGRSTHDTAGFDLAAAPVPDAGTPQSGEASRRQLSPVRGLVVGFRNAVEGVRQSTVPNLALVGLVTVLGILGLGDEPPWRRRKAGS